MALPTVPGQVGYVAYQYNSGNKRALAKFTDKNHIQTLINDDKPTPYDREIIDIYTQTSLESDDFTNLINQSDPYYADDTWTWKIRKEFEYPKLVGLTATANGNANLGADQIPFELIFDTNYFQINDIITANRQFGDALKIVRGPEPLGATSYLYSVILTGAHITPDSTANKNLLTPNQTFDKIDNVIGEFDDKVSGLPYLGGYIQMYQSLSAGYAVTHTITKWADEHNPVMSDGTTADIIVYDKMRRNANGSLTSLGSRWEPWVERQMKMEMLKIRKNRILYGQGGSAQTDGHKGESKGITEGILSQIRHSGHYMPINKGDFSINMLRDLFGSLFYRRIPMNQRRVKLYTNEAGIRMFRQANKEDLFASGITIIADDRFIKGSGQNMQVNYGFDSTFTMETGVIEVSHLMELDLPELNSEYGTESYSLPLFLAFDISNATGSSRKNIREVRKKGAPSMTWGYINGRQHHLGHAASKGYDAANMFPGYQIFMDDNADVFIEDLSRCVLIEQIDPRVFRTS